MKILIPICLLMLFCRLVIAEPTSDKEVIFLTHNLKNNVYWDVSGELRGVKHAGRRSFNLELVRAMALKRGVEFKPAEVPFLRGYDLVLTGPSYAIFNISRNPERENQVKWVGPLQVDEVTFFANKQYQVQVTDFSRLSRDTHVCVLRGSRHLKILKAETEVRLSVANSYDSCFRMLADARVDLTPVSLHDVAAVFKASGIAKTEVRQTSLLLYRSEGYIAFSKQVSDAVIADWQQVLDDLKQSGEYLRLRRQYLLPDLDQAGSEP